jgi:hypothetical protein
LTNAGLGEFAELKMVKPVEVGAGPAKAAAVVLNLLAAAINLTPAKTRPLLALGRPGFLADVRFAPEAVVLENYIPQRKAEV